MKTTKRFAATAVAVLFLALGMSSFTTVPTNAPTVTTTSYRYDLRAAYNPCSREIIDMKGQVHQVVHRMRMADGRYLYRIHTNYAGIQGEGRRTGNKYVMNGTTKYSVIRDSPELSYSYTVKRKIIGKGKAKDYTLTYKLAYERVCDPTCRTVIKTRDYSVECK